MKYVISALLFLLFTTNLIFSNSNSFFPFQNKPVDLNDRFVITMASLDPNNISTWFVSTGIFNQDLRTSNTPGFMWPKGSNRFAIFTTGLTIAALVNGNLRMAAASYHGEYTPGYITDSSGIPVARTDNRFKIYKVVQGSSGDPDWQNWGNMVPYGAPFFDVNHNGIYEPATDIPGIKDAAMTIFICLTDGFASAHTPGEGFGGGTSPLFAEVHLTAWAFSTPGLEDVDFVKWQVVNKSHTPWNSTYFSVVCDPDLGNSDDDYIGCDTVKQLGYCYNGDNNDEGTYGYGANPPAVGIDLFESAVNRSVTPPKTLGMTSFTYCINSNSQGPDCERDPSADPQGAYKFMKGIKKDGSPWVIPPGGSSNITKYCYSGNPETGVDWTEGPPGSPSGSVQNCGGLTGPILTVNFPGDRRFLINTGADNFTVSPGETQTLAIGQMIARGSSNLNSVTKLKQLDIIVQNLYLIGVNKISENILNEYVLFQNYPNPFNPTTKIKFEIPLLRGVPVGRDVQVKFTIYDILGKEIDVLINNELKPGTYEINWDASNYPSGVYYYRLSAIDPSASSGQGFSQTRKMVLIK